MLFPESFLWGVSVSGFQFEMGDPSGKDVDPNTDWFVWVRDPRNIQKGVVSGDLPEKGVDYWNLYEKDHSITKKLGLNAYRIGTEWSRIFPESTKKVEVGVERASDGNIAEIDVDEKALEELGKTADKEAVNHYRAIIKDLRAKKFEVFVCVNHFTLPLWIHDPITVRDTRLRRGPRGWVDEETIIEFTKYTAYLAWSLGDIVDDWAIFNEPMVVSEAGYTISESGFPPGLNNFKASKKAAQHMVIAYARAYDAIKRGDTVKANNKYPAHVGVIHNVIPVKPFDEENETCAQAANVMDRMHNHFFLQSISYGWLDQNLNGTKDSGEMKGYLEKRLDWLGVNYYTRLVVKGRKSIAARLFAGIPVIPEIVRNYGFACQPNSTSADGIATSDFGWEVYPEGLFDVLESMKRYEKPLYVTENGIADASDGLRSSFISAHLKTVERAIEKKIDVRGYFHWSLTDNYEWAKGFGMKFGLYNVDLKTKKRTARKSAKTYEKIIEIGEATQKNEKATYKWL